MLLRGVGSCFSNLIRFLRKLIIFPTAKFQRQSHIPAYSSYSLCYLVWYTDFFWRKVELLSQRLANNLRDCLLICLIVYSATCVIFAFSWHRLCQNYESLLHGCLPLSIYPVISFCTLFNNFTYKFPHLSDVDKHEPQLSRQMNLVIFPFLQVRTKLKSIRLSKGSQIKLFHHTICFKETYIIMFWLTQHLLFFGTKVNI